MQYCATFFEHLDLEVNSTNYKVRLIHINTEILSAPLHNLDSNVSLTVACVAVFGSVSNTHNSFTPTIPLIPTMQDTSAVQQFYFYA